MLAICAISARFSKHPAVRHNPPFLAGELYAVEARRQLLKNFDIPSITNLTVCLILGVYEFGSCRGGRAWALGGIATGMAHALKLHKEVEQDPMARPHPLSVRPDYMHEGGIMGGYMSFIDKEIRRRCMWGCFIMDRFNSSGTEKPWTINEADLEIQLPVHDRNLQLNSPAITEQLDGGVKDPSNLPEDEKLAKAAENMGIGAYIVRVISIFGRVVKYVNQVRLSFLPLVTRSHSCFGFLFLLSSSFMYLQMKDREAKRKIPWICGIPSHTLLNSTRSSSTLLMISPKPSPTHQKT